MKKTGCVTASALGIFAAALISIPLAQAQTQPDTPAAQLPQPGASEAGQAPQAPAVLESQTPKPESAAQPAPKPEAAAEQAPGAAQPSAETQPVNEAKPAAADQKPDTNAAAPQPETKSVTLRIATSEGAYIQSQERALFEPFTKRHGIQVKAEPFEVTADSLKTHAGEWDLVDIDGGTAAAACKDQLLEPLDAGVLDGAEASEDFFSGAIQPCAVASVAWSAVVVYDTGAKKAPAKLAEFFDVKKLPGKRVLLKQPQYTLEMALLGDGVAPADVYTTLATPEGENRAFAKLTGIKNNIVWADKPSAVFEQLKQKDVAMGMAFSGRAFSAIVSGRQPIAILWDRQIYNFDYWAIPHGAKNAAAAKEFIRFATSAGQLADQTRWLPYGPARRSALKLAGKHAELDMDMKPYLPTHEPNMQGALAYDGAWWTANGPRLLARFTAWLDGKDTPASAAPTSQ